MKAAIAIACWIVLALFFGAVGGILSTKITGPGITIARVVPAGITDKKLAQRAMLQWPDLEQAKVDGLTAALGKAPKRKVLILCKDKADCGDLALDLENAFESAKWDVRVEQPLMDDTVGVGSTDRELGLIVAKATGLNVKLIDDIGLKDTAALVIGRKPK